MIDASPSRLSSPSRILLGMFAVIAVSMIAVVLAVALTPISWPIAIALIGVGGLLLADELRWWFS